MSLDPAPLLDAARWGRPWHDADGCTMCERGTDSDRVPACVSPTDIAETLGVSRSTVQKWRSGHLGLSQKMGERCAATLGLLDHEVWPDLLEAAIAEVTRECEIVDCFEVYELSRSHKRFCSANCRNRSPQAKARRTKAQRDLRQRETPEQREERLRRARRYKATAKPAIHVTSAAYYRRTSEKQRADRKARYWREQAA